jgi:hypothetical protein
MTNNTSNAATTGFGSGIKFKNALFSNATEQNKWAGIAGVAETSYSNTMAMAFYTPSNVASSAPQERMRITSGGDVLIGKTVNDDNTKGVRINPIGYLAASRVNNVPLILDRIGTDGSITLYRNDTTQVGSVSVSGTATSYNTSSDYRLKEDLKDFNGLDKVSKIPVYDYKWKSEESRSYGVMAHELQEVLPDAVSGEKDAEEMQGVDYSKIVPLLIKSIQELKAEIDILKAK